MRSGRTQSYRAVGDVVGVGGAGGIRTPDIRLAKAALSQLSYGPAELLAGHGSDSPG